MGRPKKVQTPLPEQSPSNPNQVQSLLGNAKLTVEAAKLKRKSEGEHDVGSVPTPCKAKTAPPPCPKVPQHRHRSKSPANVAVKATPAKAGPAKPAAPPPKASSAFQRVQDVLVRAKAMKLEVDARAKATAPAKQPAEPAKQPAAPAKPASPVTTPKASCTVPAAPALASKAVSVPLQSPPPKAVTKASSEDSLADSLDLTTPPPTKAFLSPPGGSTETLTTAVDTPDHVDTMEDSDMGIDEWHGHSWKSYGGYDGTYSGGWDWSHGWNASGYSRSWSWGNETLEYPYDSQWRLDPSPHSTWRPGDDSQQVREFLAGRQPSFMEQLSEAGESKDADQLSVTAQEGENENEGEENAAEEKWMRDKKGNFISPAALYMRFYRKLRSKLESKSSQFLFLFLLQL